MKLSTIVSASFIAMAAFALAANDASAAAANTGKTNTVKIDASNPNGEKDCTTKGGKVSTDKDGNKMCTTAAVGSPAGTGIGKGDQPPAASPSPTGY